MIDRPGDMQSRGWDNWVGVTVKMYGSDDIEMTGKILGVDWSGVFFQRGPGDEVSFISWGALEIVHQVIGHA